MKKGRIVLLALDGASTRIIYHALQAEFSDIHVILEERISCAQFLRWRVKKLGIAPVVGQVLFAGGVVPLLRRAALARIEVIRQEFGFDESPITDNLFQVSSVNSEETRKLLRQLKPRVVVVNGTRIIGKKTLSAVAAPFVNMHMGITPRYRGVHGGYWALTEGHPELAGTTVHFVDEGVDTGDALKQATFMISSDDSFVTYPYLHLSTGIPMLKKAIQEILTDSLERELLRSDLPSKQWFHPTFWEYWKTRLLRGVK